MARRLWSNFSKGEISPELEGRPELAQFFEGCRTLENWTLRRLGGVVKRPGTRMLAEAKYATKDTILLPFEVSVNTAYMLELGDSYFRVYRNKAQITTSAGGPAVEKATPYLEADLRAIHHTHSVDVKYLFNPDLAQRRISRASDTDWAISAIVYAPPPSYEALTDIGTGASAGVSYTLTPSAVSGDVVLTASGAVFLAADVGRYVVAGTARAVITAFGASAGDTASPNDQVRATVLDAFGSTSPIAAGSWLMFLSPQTTLSFNAKEPIGAYVTMTAGANAFRSSDVGKYVKAFGGVVRITGYSSPTSITGVIESVLSDISTLPGSAPAGAWSLNEPSWDSNNGWPRTGEFFQGRLWQAASPAQPTTLWGSRSDDYENYAVGILADDGIEYTIASRQVNRVEWLAEHKNLFPGTSGAEFVARGGGTDTPIGGDNLPVLDRLSRIGSAPIQPVVHNRDILFVDQSRLKVFVMPFNATLDTQEDPLEVTLLSEHITSPGIRLGPAAFRIRPDPTIFFVREDGTLLALTYFPKEKVIGWARWVTDGTFESVGVVPGGPGSPDHIYVLVKRTIDGTTKRFIEVIENEATELTARSWQTLQTDCAITYVGAATTTLSVPHLEGKDVQVVADGGIRYDRTVSGGVVTINRACTQAEIGLPITATLQTMRPAVDGGPSDGLTRSWAKLWIRLKESWGGTVQAGSKAKVRPLAYPTNPADPAIVELYSGTVSTTGEGWDEDAKRGNDGRVTIVSADPFPMHILSIFGDVEFGG